MLVLYACVYNYCYSSFSSKIIKEEGEGNGSVWWTCFVLLFFFLFILFVLRGGGCVG